MFTFSTKEEMYAKEREIVTVDFITENNTYNLKVGGSGGNPGIIGAFSGRKHKESSKLLIKEKRKLQAPPSENTRRKMSDNNAMKRQPDVAEKVAASLRGRTHTQEHKSRVAAANIGKVKINNGLIAKAVSKEEAAVLVNDGWKYGLLPRKRAVV